MVFVNSLGQQETAEKFAHLWFAGMARFQRVKDRCTPEFDEQHVIAIRALDENANVETPNDD
jgi:hypothetical protein